MILSITVEKQSYDIIIKNGVLGQLAQFINTDRKVMIITDDGVPSVYVNRVKSQFKNHILFTISQGEASKSFKNFGNLIMKMLNAEFTSHDCIIALGGGVVGDLSGFAASCYMHGIDFYNIPTTLLAQIDSSVGGKNAIDFDGIKNTIGTFYQPKKVLIDPTLLESLDSRQLNAGLAEAIKTGIVFDKKLFEVIEQSRNLHADLPEIIIRSLKAKKSIVESDPRENSLRRVLNFGHTIGHAIESYYKGDYLHGECIAAGMVPMCSDEVAYRLIRVLKKYNLPTYFSGDINQLMPAILHDKKRKNGFIQTVYVDAVGEFRFLNMSPKDIFFKMEKAYGSQLWANRSAVNS